MSEPLEESIRVRVRIRRNADGAIRVHEDDWWGRWQWTEGNYGCDCNRYLFFQRAEKEEEDSDLCGTGRYSIRVEDISGTVIYDEFNA